MNLNKINQSIELLESKCITEFDNHFLDFLLVDYYEGGNECLIDNADEEWHIDKLLNEINNIFYALEKMMLDWEEERILSKKLLKCKLALDRRINEKGLIVEFYTGFSPYDRLMGENSLNVIEKNIVNNKLKNEIKEIHSSLLNNKYVNENWESFWNILNGESNMKINWLKSLDSLAFFANEFKYFLSDESSRRHYVTIANNFTRNGKPVTNKGLSSAFNNISNKSEEIVKSEIKFPSST